jgi:hypothetical protein
MISFLICIIFLSQLLFLHAAPLTLTIFAPAQNLTSGPLYRDLLYDNQGNLNFPALQEPGVSLEFSAGGYNAQNCRFTLCVKNLLSGNLTIDQFPANCQYVNTNLTNFNAGPIITNKILPGITHFLVYSSLADNSYSAMSQCDFSITLNAANACDSGQYFNQNSGNCAFPVNLLGNNGPKQSTIIDPSSLYSTLPPVVQSSAFINQITFSFNATGVSPSAPITLLQRLRDSPRSSAYDRAYNISSATQRYTLQLPANTGIYSSSPYFFEFLPQGAVNSVSVGVSAQTCQNGTFWGVNCNLFVNTLSYDGSSIQYSLDNNDFNQNQWFYAILALNNPYLTSFALGVGAFDGQQLPDIYLRAGALPTAQQYDLKISRGAQQSAYINSGITNSVGVLWFLGLHYPGQSVVSGGLGLWLASNCASDCNTVKGQGTCNNITNSCSCADNWGGFDCSINTWRDRRLSSVAKPLLAVFTVVFALALGFALCYYFRRDWFRASENRNLPGQGHRLDQPPANNAANTGNQYNSL